MAETVRERRNARARLYRERFPERVRESQRKYRATHLGERSARRAVLRATGRNRVLAAAYRKKRAQLALAFIDAAKASGCVDCGEKDLRVLDLDHVRGTKKFEPSSRLQSALVDLFAEIDKCETRCANCHRRVTAQRRKAA